MSILIRRLWLWFRGPRPDCVSVDWLAHQDRQTSRVAFDGPRISFPVKKLINHASPRMMAERLRKRA